MKLNSNHKKQIWLLFLSIGLMLILNSCSTIDYISYTSPSHGTKMIRPTHFSLITYNIKAIYQKEENEVDNLMTYVNNEGFDFVIFQEIFNESTRGSIIEKTDKNKFTTIISRVDYNSFPEFIFQDAGLFMMSRYPRIDLSEIDFGGDIKNSNGIIHMILDKEMSRSNDFLANKSILGALFDLGYDKKLFLFTTHVQALGTTEHKEFQFLQVRNFIETAVNGVLKSEIAISSKNLAVVLAGDFNSDAYNNERFASLQYLLGNPRDLHKEFHGEKQEYTFKFSSRSPSRRFDYILAYDDFGEFRFHKINVQSITTVDITSNEGNSISDHLGLKATIKLD